MMYDFELINLTTRVKLKEWIKNLTFIEPDEKTTTLLRNWLLWYFISQCGRSTDSNNLKVALKSSPHTLGNCQSHLYLRMDWSVTLATFALYLSSQPIKKIHASLMCTSTSPRM